MTEEEHSEEKKFITKVAVVCIVAASIAWGIAGYIVGAAAKV